MGDLPLLLAIETSQRRGGVAVRDRTGAMHEESLATQLRHDDDLLPSIDRLYERLGLTPRQTEAIGVSVGPGGFTGLRIAVSTAKMMTETLGAKIVAVPSALVAAESHDGPGPIVVALASKQDTFWATRLARDQRDNNWTIEGAGRIANAENAWLNQTKVLLGDSYLPSPVRAMCEQLGVDVIEPQFSPLACARVATRMLAAGETVDPLQLAPIYPRPPTAVTNWKRGVH